MPFISTLTIDHTHSTCNLILFEKPVEENRRGIIHLDGEVEGRDMRSREWVAGTAGDAGLFDTTSV